MDNLKGKVALITGAGQGLGRGIALALAAEGADIGVVDINPETAQQTVDLVQSRGRRALAITADVRNPEDIARSVSETVTSLGGINILVNSAQTFPLGPLLDIPDDAIVSGFESGAYGTLRYMRACHPYLKGDGVVINLSSPSSVRPEPPGFSGAYGAVKSAINLLTRAAAVEWASDNIRAMAILPVGSSPAGDKFMLEPGWREKVLQAIPLKRIGDAEKDIGRLVAFLCGPDATYMTGVLIPIDGGATYLN